MNKQVPFGFVCFLFCFAFASDSFDFVLEDAFDPEFDFEHIHNCYHDEVKDAYYEEFPEHRESDKAWNQRMAEKANTFLRSNHSKSTRNSLSLVRIPVVWHILYSDEYGGRTYIDESKINDDMNYLNQWFTATNKYYTSASSYFANSIADASDFQIEFVLASVDPDGNPTNGITYKDTSVSQSCGTYEIFIEEDGGIDTWNPLHYLNIFSCNLTNGLNGYALFPLSDGRTLSRDAVVLQSDEVGYSYRSGSLIAHEVGHWLGVDHTFKGCASPGDSIDDTPPLDVSSSKFVSKTAPCPGYGFAPLPDEEFVRCGNVVMVQNVMDYNIPQCIRYFTKGQAALMRSWLDTPGSSRNQLATSPGLGGATTPIDASNTPSKSRTSIASNTPSRSRTSIASNTPSRSRTSIASNTPSKSRSRTPTSSHTRNVSPSRTRTRTSIASTTPTRIPTPNTSSTPFKTNPFAPNEEFIQEFRETLLGIHNLVRSEVDPPAQTPLTQLNWSSALESLAQNHVEKCVYTSDSSSYGKTKFALYDDPAIEDVYDFFYWQVAGAPRHYYTIFPGGSTCTRRYNGCEDYTQIIWDNENYPTTHVGCAISPCSTGTPIRSDRFGGHWAFAYCLYSGAGNYLGELPYVPQDVECASSCDEGECGYKETPCGEIDCGCCDDPCADFSCGVYMNDCMQPINCGNCADGTHCHKTNDQATCVQDGLCIHEEECAANNRECDYSEYCDVVLSCGYCSPGDRCENFRCVEDPCFNCPVNSACSDNECICLTGFIEDNLGNCIAQNSGGKETPDYTNMFKQIYPEGNSFTVADGHVFLQNDGPHILDWTSSLGVIDAYTTNTEITVSIESGEFGFNLLTGMDDGVRALDCLRWLVKDIGGSPSVALCVVYDGTLYCNTFQPIDFPTSDAKVRITLGTSGAFFITTFRVDGGEIYSGDCWTNYFPTLGSISYYISPSPGHTASLSNAVLTTSTTMTISLSECIDDSEWADIFYQLSGADPRSTSVAIRGSDDATDCAKSLSTGKALVSGFTTVITSGSVAASTLSSTVASSTGSAAAAIYGVTSATTIPGSAGAAIAGFPTTIGALGGSILQSPGGIPIEAAAGGVGTAAGGGGGSSGLSGGAIAGIVVGSIAGGLLILGAASIVIIAVVAAAILLATKDEEGPEQEGPSKAEPPKSIRRTIKSFFGGVDVMANDPNARHSITARSPGF